MFAALAILHGCSQSSGGGTVDAIPPPLIQVTVNPPTGSVILGNTQTFAAAVTGTANTAVTWSVNGVPGGNATTGTITPTGAYTAPADLPSPASVQITATSAADPTKSATAAVSIISDIVVQITPNIAGVELGALQPFSATIVSAGLPIKIVVMNNGYLGMVRQWQELFWDRKYSHVDMGEFPDFVKLAEAYGVTGMRFEDKRTLVEDMKRAIATDGPVLVDVRVTREENTYPMIPAGHAAREMVG